MLESPALVLRPLPAVAVRVQYLAVIELFGLNVGEVLVDLDLPLVEEACLGKLLNKVVDAVESIYWL